MQQMRESGEDFLSIDVGWLARERPGLVIAQSSGVGVSAEELPEVRALAAAGLLGSSLSSITVMLQPQTLGDVVESIAQVGMAAGVPQAADELVGSLRHRLRSIARIVSAASTKPRVLSLESVRPLIAGGHWLPEMKQLAGGIDEMQDPGAAAERLRWEQVLAYSPDVLLVITSSSSLDAALQEVVALAAQPAWWAIPAVRNSEVYVCDHTFFSRPGPRLVDGVETLARIFHPKLFTRRLPPGRVMKLSMEYGQHCRPRQIRSYFAPYV